MQLTQSKHARYILSLILKVTQVDGWRTSAPSPDSRSFQIHVSQYSELEDIRWVTITTAFLTRQFDLVSFCCCRSEQEFWAALYCSDCLSADSAAQQSTHTHSMSCPLQSNSKATCTMVILTCMVVTNNVRASTRLAPAIIDRNARLASSLAKYSSICWAESMPC